VCGVARGFEASVGRESGWAPLERETRAKKSA